MGKTLTEELFDALKITSSLVQGCISENAQYKIEGKYYRVGELLDSTNELLGRAKDQLITLPKNGQWVWVESEKCWHYSVKQTWEIPEQLKQT
jgi:hypothetical protein